ncbi:MAG: Crp/Fnr family transcriptional regulator [Ignavibacteriae bacterium HGW-Ignavibacteriae-2]|nr:Crp/Fnr family transcriptional regulator [Bacteroidota bacterium]PKL89947.1 MAG: Crp/Fnr family transcriptional regulator [Ignavibacteriae bacterium HGW-Ignavibacteriae-2]
MTSSLESLMYVPIFSDLPEETIQKISSVGMKKKYEKDSVILMEEDSGSAMFVIASGKVKVARISNDGREVILSILGESDFFGEMAILDGLSRSASVIAMEDSELFIIQRDEFLNLLKLYPEISINLLQELTQRLRSADMKIKALSLKDAEGKVATVILQLAEDMGKIRQGVVEIDKLPLQQDLANMAGTSRETISRTLHSFAKKGLVELEGSKLRILNFDKFRETYI